MRPAGELCYPPPPPPTETNRNEQRTGGKCQGVCTDGHLRMGQEVGITTKADKHCGVFPIGTLPAVVQRGPERVRETKIDVRRVERQSGGKVEASKRTEDDYCATGGRGHKLKAMRRP